MRRPALLALALCACLPHHLEPAGATIALPRDEGAHPAQTEWWHFHGHLVDERGERYDFFLGFVRWHTDEDRFLGVPVRWAVDPGQIALFSVTDRARGRYHSRDKYAYPDIWAATAAQGHLRLRHDDWSAESRPEGTVLHAAARGAELDLTLGSGKPVVLEGRGGLLQVPPNSHHFYTQTRLPAAGTLEIDGRRLAVHGDAWAKHQWGYLYGEQLAGWVWFGAQLSDGREVQVALLRDRLWRQVDGSFAEVVDPDGTVQHLELGRVGVVQTGETWRSPRSGVCWPVGWRLELPERNAVLELSTPVPGQELWVFPSAMWAGAMEISGRFDGEPVRGQAMAEIFGADPPFLRRFFRSGRPDAREAP